LKTFSFLFLLLFCSISAQKTLPFDSLKLREVQDLFADDYGNIYLYKNKDFTFTKYDSLGNRKGKLMLTLPFKIQSVQNVLSISSFSENAQEIKFFDQNLVEIQTVNFRQKFGYISKAYAEDRQQIWLLDESAKRLIQYKFREDQIINSYPIDINFENILDFLVFDNKIFLLTQAQFSVYNFKSEKIFQATVSEGKKLRRENKRVLIMGKNFVQEFENLVLKTIFKEEDLQIVDKNRSAYFGIKGNKLYLYPLNDK